MLRVSSVARSKAPRSICFPIARKSAASPAARGENVDAGLSRIKARESSNQKHAAIRSDRNMTGEVDAAYRTVTRKG
jgi:hypothetical protein